MASTRELAYEIALAMYPYAATRLSAANDRLDRMLIAAVAMVPVVPLTSVAAGATNVEFRSVPLYAAGAFALALLAAYGVGTLRGSIVGLAPGVLASDSWSSLSEDDFKDAVLHYAEQHQKRMAGAAAMKRWCLYVMFGCLVAQAVSLIVWAAQQVGAASPAPGA